MEKFICSKCPPEREYTIKNLMGWKMHHSRYHGEYSEAEEQAAAEFFSKQEAPPAPPKKDEEGPVEDKKPSAPATVTPITAAPKPPKKKTVKFEAEKANNMITAIFRGLFEALGHRRGGEAWKPTESNLKAIDESVAMMLESMGISLEIEQWNISIKNPLWLILVPILAVITLYLQIPAVEQPEEAKK